MKQENKDGDYGYKIQTKKKTHSKFRLGICYEFSFILATVLHNL